jgi:Ca-activated chloride channel family protein
MSFQFQAPYAFGVLSLLFLMIYFYLKRNRRGALRYSSTEILSAMPSTRRARLRHLPLILRSLALIMLVFALARPQRGQDPVKNITKGIAIQMVLDRSGSMRTNMQYGDERVSRFEVAKSVFSKFVDGDGKELGGRPNDLIGIIAFAGYADTISPLTHSHDALKDLLKELDVVSNYSKDGTAIGDAIALGAARLKTAEEELEIAGKRGDVFNIKSKILILLTDGQHNAGTRTPDQAALLAQEWGIKIYAIGIVPDIGGGSYMSGSSELLDRIAESTGGIFRVANDDLSLISVYEEIDRLEKTEIESVKYLTYKEYFLPFAVAALLLLLLELVLSRTILRRLP